MSDQRNDRLSKLSSIATALWVMVGIFCFGLGMITNALLDIVEKLP